MNNTNFTLWGGLDLPYTLCGVVGMCPKPSVGWGGSVLRPLWGGLGLSLKAFYGVWCSVVGWVCLKPSVGWFGSVLTLCGLVWVCPKPSVGWAGSVLSPLLGGLGLP